MQVASCLRKGEYCRLIRVSVIIVGYVQFRLKLNLEASLESNSWENLFRPSKQKECFGVVSTEIWKEVGLPFVHFMQYSDRVCNPCGWKIRNFGASFTSLLKLQLHPQRVPRLRAANILLTRGTKPAQHEENQNLFVSIREQLSHPRSKVPSRLLKANQESLTPFLFWRKLKKPKSLI